MQCKDSNIDRCHFSFLLQVTPQGVRLLEGGENLCFTSVFILRNHGHEIVVKCVIN